MFRTVLGSKIHRATVTHADLDYVGSITVDEDLVLAAGLVEGEKVHVADVSNGARLETYVIVGPRGSGQIGINGAAAHLVHPGDLVIIMSFQLVDDREILTHQPRIVHVDQSNRVVALGHDAAQPVPGAPDQRSPREG